MYQQKYLDKEENETKKINNLGQERIFASIIFVTMFFSLSALILISMNSIQTNNTNLNSPISGYEIIGGYSINYWQPTSGYRPNSSKIMDQSEWYFWLYPLWNPATRDINKIGEWWPQGEDETRDTNLYLYIIENNTFYEGASSNSEHRKYQNYFLFYRHVGWWDQYWKAISYDLILEKAQKNSSLISFKLDRNYTLMIKTDTYNFTEDFLNYNYAIYIGKQYTDQVADMQHMDFFSVIGELLTASIPNTHPIVSLMIAIPIWIAIAFIIFTLIERLVPL